MEIVKAVRVTAPGPAFHLQAIPRLCMLTMRGRRARLALLWVLWAAAVVGEWAQYGVS